MTDTLFDVLYDTYERLGELQGGEATGGGVTTCESTNAKWKDLNNNIYLRGTIFLPDDSVFAEVTAFSANGTIATWTLGTLPGSLAVAATEEFHVAFPHYYLTDAIRSVNSVLRKLLVPMEDQSLTTVAGQTEYTVPIACKGAVKQVWIQQSSTSGDYRFVPNTTWYIRQEGDAAGTETLVFRQEPDSGQTILLGYMGRPAAVSVYNSSINEYVPFDLLVQMVVVHMLRRKYRQTHDEDVADEMSEALTDLRNIKRVQKIPRLRKHARTLLGKRSIRSHKYGRWLIQ